MGAQRKINKKSLSIALFFLFILYFISQTSLVMAQALGDIQDVPMPDIQIPDIDFKPTFSLTADTLTPQPNSFMTITARLSGANNINNSNYTWSLNNVRQKEASGINKNIFAFRVGNNLGTIYKISVNILTPNGDTLSDSISATISDLDLTWEASSQTPALYRGKALPTQNSTVIISALPLIYRPGTKILFNNNDLIFNWKLDNQLIAEKSGTGKLEFTLPIDNYAGNYNSILLEVKTANNTVFVSKNLTIPVVKPQSLIYLADPKSNLPYGNTLKNLIIKPANLSFFVQNYFFNAQSDNLEWQWFVNNEKLADKGEKPWLASLNLADSDQLYSVQIQVSTKNPAYNLESTQSTFDLEVQ